MRRRRENGQALLLVILALSIFLLGALGLAIDGAQLYAHRQMAQNAADAAAQAGIMSLFNKTNNDSPNRFGQAVGEVFTCTPGTDPRTPCVYARANRFGIEETDTVEVSFPPPPEPGVQLASEATDPVRIIEVTVSRTLQTGLMRLLGPETSTIKARARAAIVDVVSPIPILVTHPDLPGSFRIGGNPTITICGGPGRSIQVNSSSSTSIMINGNAHSVDLSKAGPADDGYCNSGTGADFGDWGGPSTFPGNLSLGTTGTYVQPSSPVLDPLRTVSPPAKPPLRPDPTPLADGTNGCPPAPLKDCMLYYPGSYPDGIEVKNETAIFSPGVYYIERGGFGNYANGEMYMCEGCPSDPDTGQGMLVYNTGGGTFNVGANGSAVLRGPHVESIYKGILFFNDRNAATAEHRLGGGGTLNLTGTIYIHNTLELMSATPSTYQKILLQGTPGSETLVDGMIITSVLELQGNAGIRMKLNPAYRLNVRQVALVR